MRRMKCPADFVRRMLSISLVASMTAAPALHAQTQPAPPAGTAVTVKLMDAVNSANDAAGKQYRAAVTGAIHVANGVMIAPGAGAAIRLVNSGNGSGWTTQLVSVTVNGQPVAVASTSASVISAAQTAAKNKLRALSAMNSALAGSGHHVNAPAGIAAVATGQQVILPMGTILHFVLAQPAAPSPAVSAGQPVVASAAPVPGTAPGPAVASGASGALTEMAICFSNPPPFASDPNHNTEYLTAVLEVPPDAKGRFPDLQTAFAEYLKATDHAKLNVTCQPIWSVADAQTTQRKIASDHGPRVKLVDTGWRYGLPPLAQGQNGFDPLAVGPGGLDLSQHRLTTYFCRISAAGGTTMEQTDPALANEVTYVSPVFEADWNLDSVVEHFDVFIRDHYVHDLNVADKSRWCLAASPAAIPPGSQEAAIRTTSVGHSVAVDFTDTPAQIAAGRAAATQTAAAEATALKLGPDDYYVFCVSDPSAQLLYFSDVFVGKADPNSRSMHGAISLQNVASVFLAFLRQKYSFKSTALCRAGVHGSIESGIQELRHRLEDQYKQANKQIVETGWKNAS